MLAASVGAPLAPVLANARLPVRQLEVTWQDRALRHRVVEDTSGGLASGVSGTPTFFINGALYEDSWELDDLATALRDAGATDAHHARRDKT